MADALDEFDFDDDALDALPATTLDELERDALLSTQHPQSWVAAAASTRQGRGAWQQDMDGRAPASAAGGAARPPSDYGFDDEDIINLDEQPLEVQRAYHDWSQHQRIVDLAPPGPAQDASRVEGAEGHTQVDVVELQARLLQVGSIHHRCAGSAMLTRSSWKASAPTSSEWSKRQGLRHSRKLERQPSSGKSMTCRPKNTSRGFRLYGSCIKKRTPSKKPSWTP